jgi:SHAQKYF class myb-like DNA-binding protein
MSQPFSASYQAAGSSVMSFPDPDNGNHDNLALNPQTQHYLTAAYNTPDNVSFDLNVFDQDNDISIDPLNQSNDDSLPNTANFDNMGDTSVHHHDDDVPDSALCPPGSEATGRWTKKEHELFTEALHKYGKEWKKVASMVKTRTVVQTRTHAQKYFQKVLKGGTDSDVSSNNGSESKRPRTQSSEAKVLLSQCSEPNEEATGEGEDYFYYESEQPSRKRQTTTFCNNRNNATPSASVKPISEDDIPPPSPASCGKRKDAEISAVISLMGSPPTAKAMENGIHTLARMREAYRKPSLTPMRAMNASPLSIINPSSLPASEMENPPDTPWDGEMLALESHRLKNSYYVPMNVATSKEQDDFIHKVCSLIIAGDVSSLLKLLQAAKLPEETNISPGGSVAGDIGNAADMFLAQTAQSGGRVAASSAAIRSFSPRASGSQRNPRTDIKPSTVIADMLNRIDEGGNSALHLACGSGVLKAENFHNETVVLEMCKVLIEYGASVSLVNSKLQSCVHLASSLRYQSVVNLLIMKGCPVNCVDDNGDCATHVAARHNDIEMLSILTNSGVNCHIRNKAAKCALDLLDDCEDKNMNRHEVRTALLTMEPRLRTLVLYHEDCLEHAARRESDWEGPDRLQGIMTSLHNKELFPPYEVEISNQFQKAHVGLLSRVHCPEYIAFVNSLSKKVQESTNSSTTTNQVVPFTPQVQMKMFNQNSSDTKADINCDTSFSAGTLKAARRAAGAVAHAVDRVLLGRNRNAFCVVRPPGHHAGYRGLLDGAKSCGFCIFNNVAAGAFHALETHNCERVAIIDIDVHHGNGTEDIVRRYPNPSRIFFFSLHLYEKGEEPTEYEFFPGSGGEDDTTHNIINVPLMPMWHETVKSGTRATAKSSVQQPPRTGRDAYKQAISQRLIPALRAFSPDLILLSTGFDAAEGDVGNVKSEAPTGGIAKGMDLRPVDFEWTTTELLKVADLCCNGRIVSVLEGGYGSYPPAKKQSHQNPAGKQGGGLDRNILSECSAAHVDRLIDPYGQMYEHTTSPF